MNRYRADRPIAVDVFSGAGGLSIGFEQAGFDIVAAVEYDPVHAVAHRFNFPTCEVLCRDVRMLGRDEVLMAARRGFKRMHPERRWMGRIDALIGGPSCQGFSVGGIREEDDERNELLLEFVRLVEDLRPRSFCFENVPGLLEPRFNDIRSRALKRLREAGYSISGHDGWIDAADYGVPQHRKRVFVLGVLDGPSIELPSPSASRITVGDALQGLPRIEKYPSLLLGDTAQLRADDLRRRQAIRSPYAADLAGIRTTQAIPGNWNAGELSNALRTRHSEPVVERFRATVPGTVEEISQLYRLDTDSLARTLRAGTGRERGSHTSPRPIHPTLPRVITVREAARLHSFPDWFRFNATNWHGHRQIGNSVPPALSRAVGEQLFGYLRGKSARAIPAERRLGTEAWRTLPPAEAAVLLNAVSQELPPYRSRGKTAVTH